jgi:hypothetical protein
LRFDIPMKMSAKFGDFTLGPDPPNFRPEGEALKIMGAPGKGAPHACAGRFVPLPAE